ncbi:MAG: hypothetical protein E7Z93_05885 [Cyanobacteria bacterium SIG32]|nr:hypothetical protein [Cyanobacteria bacterium SIG32]
MSLAEQFEDNEQYEQAYEEYKKELLARPNDLSLLERLGHLAMMLNKKEEAAEHYSKILEKDMTNTLCYEQLMDVYIDTDKYKYYVYRGNLHSVEHKFEHAISDYKKALNHTDNEQEIIMTRFTLANLYDQTGNTTKAIDEFLKTLEYEDNNEEIFIRLADLYVKEDIFTSAIDVLERAVQKFNTDSVREKLARLYLKNDQPQLAKNLTSEVLFKVKCMLECGEVDAAYKILTENQSKYSNDAEFHALMAQYYFVSQDYDKALESVEAYNKINPNSPLVYQMRALIYENKNDDYNAHLNWGKFNLVRKNKDIAINEFLNAYQLNEKNVDLMLTLTQLLEETGDRNHAIEFWEKISKLEPTNKKAWEKLAEFRESIGDYRLQADYLENLYELDKRNAVVVKKLAQTFEKLKNKPSAIEYYTKYTQIASNADDVELIRQKLQKLEHTNMQEDEGLLDKIMRLFNK